MNRVLKVVIAPLNIVFASFVLLLLVFTTNALIYKANSQSSLSRAFVTTSTGSGESLLTLNFDLDPKEKTNFQSLARELGFAWSGESLEIGLNDPLFEWASFFDNTSFGLKAGSKQLRFSAISKLPIPTNTSFENWEFTSQVPQTTLLYYQGPAAKNLLPESLRAPMGESWGAWGIFTNEGSANAVWIFKVADKSKIEDDLMSLAVEGREESTTSIKLTEGVVDTNRVFNYHQLKAPLTLGILGENLVVTTGEEAFRLLARIYNGQENSLSNSAPFNQATNSLDSQYLGFYLTTMDIPQNLEFKNLDGLLELENLSGVISEQLKTKIQTVSLGIGPEQVLEGVVNLR